MNQISLLLHLYVRPLKAFSRILDEGRIAFAAVVAIAVVLALQLPRVAEYRYERYKALVCAFNGHVKDPSDAVKDPPIASELDDDDALALASLVGPPLIQRIAERLAGVNPTEYFTPLVSIALCFVPVGILVLTKFEAIGSFSMVLQRDYSPLLACSLFAWAAAHLLLLAVNGGLWMLHSPLYNHPALWWAAHAYFLLLAALSIRTICGAKLKSSIIAIGGGWASGICGIYLLGVMGNPLLYIASPCLLYYLYGRLAPGVSALGGGLAAQQRFKKNLQTATLNPRDADAHSQLGLIYAQRRQYDAAIECFRAAINADPNEPDAYYQIGRIAREQGRYSDAIESCRAAARLDDKHSSSEVWREIGVASLLSGDASAAREALEKYVERRSYDPEGLCWYGRTLAKLECIEEAWRAFGQAIEAVQTMPPARKRQVKSWEAEAAKELRKLWPAVKTRV